MYIHTYISTNMRIYVDGDSLILTQIPKGSAHHCESSNADVDAKCLALHAEN